MNQFEKELKDWIYSAITAIMVSIIMFWPLIADCFLL